MFGLETIPIRASVAVFGVLMVVLAFFLRRYIGDIGSLAAALFLALSPGMVYISRYFIHEIFFVFLSLAIVISVIYFLEQRKPGLIAIATAALLLLVCFLPSTLNLASYLAGANMTSLWAYRGGFFGGSCPDGVGSSDVALVERRTADISSAGIGVHIADVRYKRDSIYNIRHNADRVRMRLDLASNLSCKSC